MAQKGGNTLKLERVDMISSIKVNEVITVFYKGLFENKDPMNILNIQTRPTKVNCT